jgi:hypothetical protein
LDPVIAHAFCQSIQFWRPAPDKRLSLSAPIFILPSVLKSVGNIAGGELALMHHLAMPVVEYENMANHRDTDAVIMHKAYQLLHFLGVVTQLADDKIRARAAFCLSLRFWP